MTTEPSTDELQTAACAAADRHLPAAMRAAQAAVRAAVAGDIGGATSTIIEFVTAAVDVADGTARIHAYLGAVMGMATVWARRRAVAPCPDCGSSGCAQVILSPSPDCSPVERVAILAVSELINDDVAAAHDVLAAHQSTLAAGGAMADLVVALTAVAAQMSRDLDETVGGLR